MIDTMPSLTVSNSVSVFRAAVKMDVAPENDWSAITFTRRKNNCASYGIELDIAILQKGSANGEILIIMH